jgi:hypothetical protein
MAEEEKAPNKLIEKLNEKMDKMAIMMERTLISDYIELTKRPWKIILFNFLGGVGRGFGIAIGMTLVAALVIVILGRILSHLITLPFIGKQLADLVSLVNQYMTEATKIKVQ